MNLNEYYRNHKDAINSSIMEIACDLAVGQLLNAHDAPFETFVEADDPDDPDSGTHYKEEFQKEYDKYYDEDVIMALGTSPNPMSYEGTPGLEKTRKGCVAADEHGCTSCPNIFAGGDAATGAATVILAMGAGKNAAHSIDAYIKSKG